MFQKAKLIRPILARNLSFTNLSSFSNSLPKTNILNFWQENSDKLEWFKKPEIKTHSSSGDPLIEFKDGLINISYNCLDRHLKDKQNSPAIIYSSPSLNLKTSQVSNRKNKKLSSKLTKTTDIEDPQFLVKITYKELHEKVSKLSYVLSNLGVQKGDNVCVAMPKIPEAIISVLSINRIGAVLVPIPLDIGPIEGASLIQNSNPKLIITCSFALENEHKIAPIKDKLDEMIFKSGFHDIKKIVFQRKPFLSELNKDYEFDFYEELSKANYTEPVPLEADKPVLITSSHEIGGHRRSVRFSNAAYGVGVNWFTEVKLNNSENSSLNLFDNSSPYFLGSGVFGLLMRGQPIFLREEFIDQKSSLADVAQFVFKQAQSDRDLFNIGLSELDIPSNCKTSGNKSEKFYADFIKTVSTNLSNINFIGGNPPEKSLVRRLIKLGINCSYKFYYLTPESGVPLTRTHYLPEKPFEKNESLITSEASMPSEALQLGSQVTKQPKRTLTAPPNPLDIQIESYYTWMMKLSNTNDIEGIVALYEQHVKPLEKDKDFFRSHNACYVYILVGKAYSSLHRLEDLSALMKRFGENMTVTSQKGFDSYVEALIYFSEEANEFLYNVEIAKFLQDGLTKLKPLKDTDAFNAVKYTQLAELTCQYYKRTNEFESQIGIYKEMIELCKQDKELAKVAHFEAENGLANAYSGMNKVEEFLHHSANAFDLMMERDLKMGEKFRWIFIYLERAISYESQEMVRSILDRLDKYKKEKPELEEYMTAYHYSALSEAHMMLSEYDKSKEYLIKGVKCVEESNPTIEESLQANKLAYMQLYSLEDYAGAFPYCQKVVDIYEQYYPSETLVLNVTRIHLALCYHNLGQSELAEKMYKNGLEKIRPFLEQDQAKAFEFYRPKRTPK